MLPGIAIRWSSIEFLSAFGTRALLATPVRRNDRVVGSVWLEDAPSTAGSRDFVRAVANMVALRLVDASIAPVAREPGATGKPIAAPETVARNFAADLRPAEIDPSALQAEIYRGMAVMVLRFTDATAMAVRLSAYRVASPTRSAARCSRSQPITASPISSSSATKSWRRQGSSRQIRAPQS